MSIFPGSGTLKDRVRVVEQRLQRRRTRIGLTAGSMIRSARSQVVSPGTLLAAGLLGAAMQRSHQMHGLRILAMLQTANAGLRLVQRATASAAHSQD